MTQTFTGGTVLHFIVTVSVKRGDIITYSGPHSDVMAPAVIFDIRYQLSHILSKLFSQNIQNAALCYIATVNIIHMKCGYLNTFKLLGFYYYGTSCYFSA